ncbi:SDR family oxidoreductase [Erythrobacter westpacificensis]
MNKVAIVSGIAHGIGKETALRFAREGAQVIGCDINEEAVAVTAREAEQGGAPFASAQVVDMFDERKVETFMDAVGDEFGRIDVLVNSAAVVEFGWIDELPVEAFRKTMTGEVESVFLACKEAWPHLKKSQAASIINFASVAAHGAVRNLPQIAHAAGKGAVLAMTRQLALEGSPHGIRANCISPGMVVTPATEPALSAVPGLDDALKGKLMLGRYGAPDDIASGCLYLASDEASWVTGSDMVIDGGMTAW